MNSRAVQLGYGRGQVKPRLVGGMQGWESLTVEGQEGEH